MRSFFVSLTLLLASTPARAAVTEISSCADIELTGNAVITTDLDCTADELILTMQSYGILDFQGHTVTNAQINCYGASANCNIQGPGTLATGDIEAWGTLRVRDMTILNGNVEATKPTIENTEFIGPGDNFGFNCAVVVAPNIQSSLKIIDSTITGAKCGVWTEHNATIRNSRFLSNQTYGINSQWGGWSARLRITDSEFDGNGTNGASGVRVVVKNSTFTNNGDIGLLIDYGPQDEFQSFGSIRDSTFTGNRIGIGSSDQKTLSISDSIITGNDETGVDAFAKNTRIRGSTVTGNGEAESCIGQNRCADIASWHEPSLGGGTTCGTSRKWVLGMGYSEEDWDICTLD